MGDEAHYFGSFRGHEATVCPRVGVPFTGFASEPLYSLKSLRGIKAAIKLTQATAQARRALADLKPDVVFATGGYSAAPVLLAARKLGIPYVVHEQNVVPGRSIKLVAPKAYCVLTTFRSGAEHFAGCQVRRVGLPLRKSFRLGGQASFNFESKNDPAEISVLAMGGSQGASALNEAVLATVVRMSRYSVRWLHLSGVTHYDEIQQTASKLGVNSHYQVRAFLDGDEMASAVFGSTLSVCRSGLERSASSRRFESQACSFRFRRPLATTSITTPKSLRTWARPSCSRKDLQPSDLESRILLWVNEPERIERAQKALAEWDEPDALSNIIKICEPVRPANPFHENKRRNCRPFCPDRGARRFSAVLLCRNWRCGHVGHRRDDAPAGAHGLWQRRCFQSSDPVAGQSGCGHWHRPFGRTHHRGHGGVVPTDAIDLKTSPEVRRAEELGLPIFRRSQVGRLLKDKKVIAVSGTHGKTTTSGMLGVAMRAAGMDPTIVVGAEVPDFGGATVEGSGLWAVVEACEAYDSFHDLQPELRRSPTGSSITSIFTARGRT